MCGGFPILFFLIFFRSNIFRHFRSVSFTLIFVLCSRLIRFPYIDALHACIQCVILFLTLVWLLGQMYLFIILLLPFFLSFQNLFILFHQLQICNFKRYYNEYCFIIIYWHFFFSSLLNVSLNNELFNRQIVEYLLTGFALICECVCVCDFWLLSLSLLKFTWLLLSFSE